MYNGREIDYIPKYIRIYEHIKNEIQSGNLKHGEKIYSESDIIKKYNVSTTTARKSLDVLRQENLIESIQGKGSFILQTKIVRNLKKVVSFTENIKRQSLNPSAKVIEKSILDDYAEYHEKLNLREGEKILKLVRIRYGDEIPLLIDTRYINLKYFPGMEELALDGSLYEIYESYNIKIVHSKQVLQLAFLNEKNAKLLNCKKYDPVIKIEGTLHKEDYTSIEYEEDLWNGTVLSFYVESSL